MVHLSEQAGGSTEASHLMAVMLWPSLTSCGLPISAQEHYCQNASRTDAIRTTDSDTVQGLTRIWLEECVGWGPPPAS